MAEPRAPPRLLLLLLLLLPRGRPTPSSPASPSPPPRCDPALAPIAGGQAKAVAGGQALKYLCPLGQSPSPVSLRRCLPGGVWEPLPGGGTPSCQAVFCPPPVEFPHGSFWPGGGARRYPPGAVLRFSCSGGFELRGDPELTCGRGGRWIGTVPACDDGAGDCPAPAVPPGASLSGSRFSLESRVLFSCAAGLRLLGSAERRCLEGGVWSGAEPQCRAPNSFDDPQEVAASFLASLTQAVELAQANSTEGSTSKRMLRLGAGSDLSIFLLLDASRSIDRGDLQRAQAALGELVEKIASYGASPRYGIITFGTDARVVLSPSDPQAADGAFVQETLQKLNYKAHSDRAGTNPHAALSAVYRSLVQQEREQLGRGLQPAPVTSTTRHVIVIMTDGQGNMGGSPVPVLNQIRELLSIGRDPLNDREDFLDVYVFGVGSELHLQTLNALASHKPKEQHLWLLRHDLDLQEVFHSMIDEASGLGLCGLARDYESSDDTEKNPWVASISITRQSGEQEHCVGSLVSSRFLLTAAHCLRIDDDPARIDVRLGDGRQRKVRSFFLHPGFDLSARRARGVPEFYDFDLALLELREPSPASARARPICLPCTEGASQALRLPKELNTCEEHRRRLLPPRSVEAFFVSVGRSELKRNHVRIKLGEQREACLADALKAPPYANVTALDDVITPRFLCTGGSEPQVDANACRGDSGGPLLVSWGKRYFQVGVISWGVLDVCKRRAPPEARDFHINLMETLPWLRERLQDEDLGWLQ